jgi:urease accessory protein
VIGLLVLALAALAAAPASAHGTVTGGGFYAAALHPVVAWEHFLLLLGTGLLLGRSQVSARLPLICLAAGLAAGLALAAARPPGPATPLLVPGGAAIVGAALAAAMPVPARVIAILAAVCGFVVGLDTDVPFPTEGAGLAACYPYAGVLVGVSLIALDAAALASVARRPPYTIAVRVGGSWIAATAVMVLALQLRHLGGAA